MCTFNVRNINEAKRERGRERDSEKKKEKKGKSLNDLFYVILLMAFI